MSSVFSMDSAVASVSCRMSRGEFVKFDGIMPQLNFVAAPKRPHGLFQHADPHPDLFGTRAT